MGAASVDVVGERVVMRVCARACVHMFHTRT